MFCLARRHKVAPQCPIRRLSVCSVLNALPSPQRQVQHLSTSWAERHHGSSFDASDMSHATPTARPQQQHCHHPQAFHGGAGSSVGRPSSSSAPSTPAADLVATITSDYPSDASSVEPLPPAAVAAQVQWSWASMEHFIGQYQYLLPLSSPSSLSSSSGVNRAAQARVRQVLDELLLLPLQASMLTTKQYHHLFDICQIAFALQLYSRCCSLYMDVIRLGGDAALASLPNSSYSNRNSNSSSISGIPDFILEAAAAAEDYRTLHQSLDTAEALMAVDNQAGSSDGLLIGPGAVLALAIYFQLLRIALQKKWRVSNDAGDAQQPWQVCVHRVLYLTRANDPEGVLSASLHVAHYTYHDTVNLSSTQAAVYALVFQRWLEADDRSPADDGRGSGSRGGKKNRNQKLSSSEVLHRITAFGLMTLLRSALKARRWDVVEWTAIYVDLYLLALKTAFEQPSANCVAEPAVPLHLDGLVALYLRCLQQSRQSHRAMAWLQRLKNDLPRPLMAVVESSLPVLRVAARLAGEEFSGEIALWSLERCLTGAALSDDIYTCLCAYARCGLPNYPAVVESLRQNGLLNVSEEAIAFCQLLHARRSVSWQEEIESIYRPYLSAEISLGDRQCNTAAVISVRRRSLVGVASVNDVLSRLLTPRVMYQTLLIFQEREHRHFMAYYRFFLTTSCTQLTLADRAHWAAIALVWAIAQANKAAVEDVVYIAREVYQLVQQQEKTRQRQCSTFHRALDPVLWQSVLKKWHMLLQQYPHEWWTTALTVTAAQQGGTDEVAQRVEWEKFLRPSPQQSAIATPLFARFLKKRHLLSLSISSFDLLHDTTVASQQQQQQQQRQGDRSMVSWHRGLWLAYIEP